MPPRSRRLALGALLFAGVAAALSAGLAALARRYASREAIEARLERMIGRDIRLGGVTLSVWPLPSVHLEDVALEPDVQIGSLDVDLLDAALLTGQIEPDEIVARRARFTLVRSEDGSFGFGGGSGGAAQERRLPAVSDIEIHDASVTWIDRSKPGLAPLELTLERFALSDLAPGQTAALALVAHPAGVTQVRIELDARVGPLGEVPALRDAPVSANLNARGVDAALVAPYLPPAWGVGLPGGVLDLAATLGTRPGGDFDARLDLQLRAPALRIDRFELVGPVRFVGGVARKAGRLSARADRVEAAEARAGGLHARELHGTLALAGGEWELALSPRTLTIADVELSGVQGSGRLRPSAALQFSNGVLLAEAARFRRFAAQEIAVSFQMRGGVIEVSDLQLETAGGKLGLRGRLEPGSPPKLALDATFEDLDLLQLASAPRDSEPTLLSGRAQLHGAMTGQDNWLAPLAGSGALRAKGGSVYGAAILTAISSALVAAVPGSGLLPQTRRPPRQTMLESATARVVVRDGLLRVDDIAAVTGDYRVRAAGSIGHDGSLQINGDVVLTSSGVDLLEGLFRAGRLSHALRLPAIPFQIRGVLGQPELRADVRSLPMASVRGLLGLPARAGNAVVGVGEAGGAAARGVFDTGRRVLGLGRREPPAPEPAPPPESQ